MQIEMLFGQTKANVNTDATISSVFALSQVDPAKIVFSINTDHNMDSLMSYNEEVKLPISISFHVRAFDFFGRIQAKEQSFTVELLSDCSLPKTPIVDAITLPDVTIDVGGQ